MKKLRMNLFLPLVSYWFHTVQAQNNDKQPQSLRTTQGQRRQSDTLASITNLRNDKPQSLRMSPGQRRQSDTVESTTILRKATETVEPIQERIIVKYLNDNGKDYAVSVASQVIKEVNGLLVVLVSDDAIQELKNHPGIQSVEVDNPVYGFEALQDITEDRSLAEQVPYGISMVEADQLGVGSFMPTVCIVDTGYAIGHPDLPTDPNQVNGTSSLDAYGGTQTWLWNQDNNGHGSHIAGVIAALSGNGKGVVGSGNIKLHIARGLSDTSRAFESDILGGIQDCIDANADVISMSLGGNGMSVNAEAMYRSAVEDHGMIMVAAAGNHGKHLHQYPASHPSVISVTAVDESEAYWKGSNFCDQIELAAPGHRILSTTTTNTAVHTTDFSYPANIIYESPQQDVSGELVYCGTGSSGRCDQANGAICLMNRGEPDTLIDDMVASCVNGGGIGAILFETEGSSGNWYATSSSIPLVRVKKERGEALLSTYQGQTVDIGFRQGSDVKEYSYEYFTGTSMATPHVAAVAALVWSHFPQCSNHEIRYALAVTAKDEGLAGCDWDYGFGIVKAKAAYDYLQTNGCNTLGGIPQSEGGCTTVS